MYAVEAPVTSDFRATLEDYHAELFELCSAPVTTEIVETAGSVEEMIAIAQTAEFLILSRNYRLRHEIRDSLSDQIIDAVQSPALGVHIHESDRPGIVGRVIERLVF